MAERLLLHAHQNPTILNKSAIMGGMLGAMVPVPFGVLIGGLLGGTLGKMRINSENEHGKYVGPPTLLNLKATAGGMIGYVGTGVVLAALAMTGAAAAAAIVPMALPLVITGTAIGAYLGGRSGKNEMAQEYNMALAQNDYMRSQAPARSREPEREPELDLAHAPTHFLENELARRQKQSERERH